MAHTNSITLASLDPAGSSVWDRPAWYTAWSGVRDTERSAQYSKLTPLSFSLQSGRASRTSPVECLAPGVFRLPHSHSLCPTLRAQPRCFRGCANQLHLHHGNRPPNCHRLPAIHGGTLERALCAITSINGRLPDSRTATRCIGVLFLLLNRKGWKSLCVRGRIRASSALPHVSPLQMADGLARFCHCLLPQSYANVSPTCSVLVTENTGSRIHARLEPSRVRGLLSRRRVEQVRSSNV